MKKELFITIFLSLFVFAAAAQAVVSTSTIRQQIKDTRQDVSSTRQDARQEVKDTQQGARQEIKATKQEARQEIKDARHTALQQIKDKRDALKITIDNTASSTKAAVIQKREALKTKIEERKVQLKEKLKQIKDERKQKVVERIDEQLRKLNEGLTDQFLAVLTQLEKVLNNIKARADKAESAGKDVEIVRAAITDAQTAIDLAREAVKTQAGKLYSVIISGEEAKLKVEVGKVRQTLHTDLAAVHKLVRAARETVHKAATALGQIPKVDDDTDTTTNGDSGGTNSANNAPGQ